MSFREFTEPDLRRLKLNYLCHPRSYKGPVGEWELHRGFRIRVLTQNALALFIGPPPQDSNLLSKGPEEGEESFMLLPASKGLDAHELREAFSVAGSEGWTPQVTLILSDDELLEGSPSKLSSGFKSAIPKKHPGLVLWVWQEMPGEMCQGIDFFNAEQILHQFGRMGRRVTRRCKWRKYIPW